MKPFRFCPACATELAPSDAEGGSECSSCRRSWYRNMAPTAGAAIVNDGKVLATVRARDPEKGKTDVPGGFLGPDEHPIAGLKREVEEELGIQIDVEVGDCLQMVPHPYGDDGDMVLALGFVARWIGGEPAPNDDVAEIRWLTADELDAEDFAWEHDRNLLRRALEEAR